jgi:hypothetical protein
MSPESIRSMLDRRPFIPFRVHVSDQASYDITNPRMAMIGGAVLVIGITRRDSDSEFFDEPVIVANRHITRLEPLVDEVAS